MEVKYAEIPGYPGYSVGTDGTVWSSVAIGRRRKDSRDEPALDRSKWKKMYLSVRNSYVYVSLRKQGDGGKAKSLTVHSLVLEAFVGPRPEGSQACHFPDRNKLNNNLSNLRWDTPSGNSLDRKEHGTWRCGEDIHGSLMTEDVVMSAREMMSKGMKIKDICKVVGFKYATVKDAIRGTTWKHLPNAHPFVR